MNAVGSITDQRYSMGYIISGMPLAKRNGLAFFNPYNLPQTVPARQRQPSPQLPVGHAH